MTTSLEPGVVSQLTPLVRRIVAPNPSVMTGPGTNTYLVGNEAVAVIDPGPTNPSHIDAILEAGAGRIRWIMVTHTHDDHSPGVAPLLEAISAQTHGSPAPDNWHQDVDFKPDVELQDGSVLKTDEFTIRAIHTPGHVSNHFCLLVEEDGMLMTGDHIMSGSTVVIIPPSGDMSDYIESLRRLLDEPLQSLAPGHGDVIEKPHAEVEKIISHRLKREALVMGAMRKCGGGTLDEVVKLAYAETPVSLHKMAKLSLEAHLIKLERDGRVARAGESWALTD